MDLPVDDQHLPLAARRFPFRSAGPHEQAEVNRRIDEVLSSVESMIYGLIRDRKPTMQQSDVDDLAQETMLHLARHSLPRFDAGHPRRPKVTTFLAYCAKNFIGQRVRRRRKNIPKTNYEFRTRAQDQSADRAVEVVAGAILSDPESHLPERQAKVLRILLDHPAMQRQDLARMLGYARASSLSMLLQRIRFHLDHIAEDLAVPN